MDLILCLRNEFYLVYVDDDVSLFMCLTSTSYFEEGRLILLCLQGLSWFIYKGDNVKQPACILNRITNINGLHWFELFWNVFTIIGRTGRRLFVIAMILDGDDIKGRGITVLLEHNTSTLGRRKIKRWWEWRSRNYDSFLRYFTIWNLISLPQKVT